MCFAVIYAKRSLRRRHDYCEVISLSVPPPYARPRAGVPLDTLSAPIISAGYLVIVITIFTQNSITNRSGLLSDLLVCAVLKLNAVLC